MKNEAQLTALIVEDEFKVRNIGCSDKNKNRLRFNE